MPNRSPYTTVVTKAQLSSSAAFKVAGNWKINDFLVIIFQSNQSAAQQNPTGMAASGVAMSLLANDTTGTIWIARNTTASDIANPAVTQTGGGTSNWYAMGFIVKGVPATSNFAVSSAGTVSSSIAENAYWTTSATGLAVSEAALTVAIGMYKVATTTTAQVTKSSPSSGAGRWTPCNDSAYSGAVVSTSDGAYTPGGDGAGTAVTFGMQTSSSTTSRAVYATTLVFPPTVLNVPANTMMIDDGPLLNADASTLPLYDISGIQGLADLTISNDNNPIDGTDGSYVNASYAQGKTVIVDGTIYTAVPFDESVVDALKKYMHPRRFSPTVFNFDQPGVRPLYYGTQNGSGRRLMVKPIGSTFNSDVDRRRAVAPFQLQFASSMAFSEGTFRSASGVSGSVLSLPMSGNGEAYPIIYFNVTAADIAAGAVYTFSSQNWVGEYGVTQSANGIAIQMFSAASVGVTAPVATKEGPYILDCKSRVLWYLGPNGKWVDMSFMVVTRDWFTLLSNQTVEVSTKVGAGDTSNVIAWDVWR